MNDELKNCLIKSIILNPIAIGSSFIIFLASCSVQQQIAKSANKDVLGAVPLQSAHVGISIYEPATNKYWYDYHGDKYFVPASNTKIPTCYAAMKYLGDSLVGLKYYETTDSLFIFPTGDPTFMLREFHTNPVLVFLYKKHKPIVINEAIWKSQKFGPGWSWDDFNASYMAERSPFPVNGNVINWLVVRSPHVSLSKDSSYNPGYTLVILNEPEIGQYEFDDNNWKEKNTEITRSEQSNYFTISGGKEPVYKDKIPFVTQILKTTNEILSDTLKISVTRRNFESKELLRVINSQPTDSVLKPMMHRSDNFFAEQSLLMVSNERLGVMNDEKIIDTILKTDFKDLPQKARWVDGSGLSRYNLFTPQDLVFILNKMKNEFGMERVKGIFPTGGQGTLANYYTSDSNYIYAKTGTLSGVVALSGYLNTKRGKELIFSVLVNNHQASGTEVRRAVEKFLQEVRDKY